MNAFSKFLGLLALTGLVACGGGGGDNNGVGNVGNNPGNSSNTYAIHTYTGTGAPYLGATVTVEDSANPKNTYSCSGMSDEDGYVKCDVPGTYTLPFVITATPPDTLATTLKTMVTSATKNGNTTVPITPLTTLLVKSDESYFANATPENKQIRLTARKNQIATALTSVFNQTGNTNGFDFLTSSFLPGSYDGMDWLLENISVDIPNLKVSKKKDSTKVVVTVSGDPSTTLSVTNTFVQTDLVDITKNKELSDFAGSYPGSVKYTTTHPTGTATNSEGQPTMVLNADGTIDLNVGQSTRWIGTYKLNSNGTSVKLSGSVGGSSGFIGYVDNTNKLTIAWKTSGTGANKGDTTKGYGSSKAAATLSKTQGVSNDSDNPLSYFAGTYTINTHWKKSLNSSVVESGDTSGTLELGSDGQVKSCSVGIFVNCTGNITAKTDNSGGATFSITVKSGSSGNASGKLTGQISKDLAATGNLSGSTTDSGTTYTLSGSFVGSK